MDEMEKDLKEHMERKNQLASDIIGFLKIKEPGITFERAEKILSGTIEVLQKVSKRREI
ncbi:hypothetical protein IMSAGC019_02540 [Lachnospiraceae bacterium]|nr:hypothetical protein IMSAGC019_02540 [Lachnospiraceae bacterium]